MRSVALCGCFLLAGPVLAQATWARRYPSDAPSPRTGAAMTADSSGQVLLFGGYPLGSTGPENATWAWDGINWRQLVPLLPPSPRFGHGLTYDSTRSRLVMFSGQGGGDDLWELAGNLWLRRTAGYNPPARHSFAMAFDANRSRVVVFGGYSLQQSTPLGDTWEYDGLGWQQLNLTTAPLPRRSVQMVFDAARGEMVLFGGEANSQAQQDTWTRSDGNWIFRQPATMPPPSRDHRLAYDAARARVVGYGFGDAFADPFAWEWDGQTWNMILSTRPTSYPGMLLAYDATRRQVVGFGHVRQVYADHGDTWVYGTAQPAEVLAYGTGCTGSAGAPILAASPLALPWLGDTLVMELRQLAPIAAGALFVTGLTATAPTSLAPFGMPGCLGHVNAAATDFAGVNNGVASWSLAIPPTTALAGVRIFQQGFAIEPGANAASALSSNGCEIVVGIR